MEALVCHPLGTPPPYRSVDDLFNTNNDNKIPSKYECSFPAERAHREQRSEAS